MEKQAKPKINILKFLPRTASSITTFFANPPNFSPSRHNKRFSYSSEIGGNLRNVKSHAGRGFSGPIVSIIPDEARRTNTNGGSRDGALDEPTSPKVSCMGQIKHRKKNCKVQKSDKKRSSFSSCYPSSSQHIDKPGRSSGTSREALKKKRSTLKGIFSGAKRERKSSHDDDDDAMSADDHKQRATDRAPTLSQMKRFSSGRDALVGIDWSAQQVAPFDPEHRNYYSDEERIESDGEYEEGYGDEDVIIPFSAPLTLVGGGGGGGDVRGVNLKPRKEINLWKRRTMAPPGPLQLHQPTMVRAN